MVAPPGAAVDKSYALLLEPLRHVTTNPRFAAVFFRRTTTQITNPGGLWDAASRIYPLIGGIPKLGPLEWQWPNGGKVKFSHLEHEQSVLNHQGGEYALVAFDELTHFSEAQFWYLLSRNRSMSGIKAYVRATCNPDADSWVARFISWWIDEATGFPIPERAGVIRWFMRINDKLFWADTRNELIEQFRGEIPNEALLPKSATFIPAKLTDNKELMRADPGYMANLLSLPTVERERLLGGNWRIRPSAGLYFQRKWLKKIDAVPDGTTWARGWDLAATPKTEINDPDFTESVLIGRMPNGNFVIGDHTWMRGTPEAVERAALRIANQDKQNGFNPVISIPQDPGAGGKAQAATYVKLLLGHNVRTSIEARSATASAGAPSAKAAKIGRFGPFSAQAEGGNVYYINGDWNTAFFDRLEAFPEASKDDTADATSRAFGVFLQAIKGESMLTLARRELHKVKPPEPEREERLPQPGSMEWAAREQRLKAEAEAAALIQT
jgi:predicted phage terminase large subunit-like protein